jgi:hypothetical protein
MQNPYKQLSKYSQRVDSEIDNIRQQVRSKRDTKGLLARQNFQSPKSEAGEPDFTKRIANYVNSIRQRRMEFTVQKQEEDTNV